MYSWRALQDLSHVARSAGSHKNSETAEFRFEASVWLAEERLLVLLSNCA